MDISSTNHGIIASKFLLDFVKEENEGDTFEDDGSEGETEVILQDEVESYSEEEGSDDEIPEAVTAGRKDYFVGRGVAQASYPKRSKSKNPKVTPTENAFFWKNTPFTVKTKTKGKNICKLQPGLKSSAMDITNEVSAFQKMVDREMVEDIVKFTNLYIDRKRTEVNYSRDRDAQVTSVTEILALFGALILIAVKHGHHTNVLEMWSQDGTGIVALRALMSYKRFLFLLRCIRFDDSATREVRRRTDKLAAIRNILDRFVGNLKKHYTIGEYMTIDEMLHPFRGRCSFVQYMPSKPAKYGLKLFLCCDAKSFYTGNLEVYCGQQMEGKYKVSNSPSEVVKRLVQPFENGNRNLTTDNWYTDYSLAQYLLSKKITLLGTMRKNKREIPKEFLPNKSRKVNSTLFGFQKNSTLVSYVPKVNKAVILLSTMHDSQDVDTATKKPVMILDYNRTKGAVDTVDKMCAAYSVARITRRWPLALFFALLNIAGINSQILFFGKHKEKEHYRLRVFLKDLAMGLMKEDLIMRSTIFTLPSDLSAYLKRYRPQVEEKKAVGAAKRGRCKLCVNNNSTVKCDKCGRFVCKKHSKVTVTCHPCLEDNEEDLSPS